MEGLLKYDRKYLLYNQKSDMFDWYFDKEDFYNNISHQNLRSINKNQEI